MQTTLNTATSHMRLYLRTMNVTLKEDYCCHSGEIYLQKGGVKIISCVAIVNVNSEMHGILPLTPHDEQNLPHCRDFRAILTALLGIHVDGKVPKKAHEQHSTLIIAPPPPSLVPSTVEML